ncbi:MAG: bifunctional adenosylcobinamide kinase/adenosylcobinamide-phosphate guanylyltransferase [Lachnospiraceae bacterium]|nr:bifunctional adenosylcobinamide kinase/adenosylcobinamide-phosphate guanylyltransferase [Lachnospiraceae bacterium]
MKIWITGGAGSGKSSLAQELAATLAAGEPHYYVATMVPRDDEDRRRISRHIEDRAGMGYRTIECPCRLTERITLDSEGTYLLDSATAMLANAMFGERDFVYEPDAAQKVAADLRLFSERVKHFVVVSDGICSDAALYDEMTNGYRCGLAFIERQMAAQCDTVIECAAGGAIVHKGKLPAGFRFSNTGDIQMELIIGGACQGKKEYAIRHFGLKDSEIFTCTEDGEPDLTVRCIDHLERYLRRCAAEDREPAAPDAFRKDAILICEDITCGIVPINALDRKWRELTGRYLQRLAGAGAEVTRVFCGFAQKLGKISKCEEPKQEEAAESEKEEPLPCCPKSPLTRHILLLRHGRTKANEEHLYCGSTDWPLSEEGSKCLTQKSGIYGTGWESFYTSGLIRTKETLELLFGEQETVIEEPDLREMDFGDFEGKSYEMLKDDQAYREWISGDNERNICPGGESGEQMRIRVRRALDRILQNDPAKRIVIVTHGGPIAAIMQQLFPEKNLNRYEWQPECGEGYLLRITGSFLAECAAEYEKYPARGENQK